MHHSPSPGCSPSLDQSPRRRIAIIGSGAAALGAAWTLGPHHDITIFEKNGHIGGHANTVEVTNHQGLSIPVDTGFIVYNQRNYPNLIRMFDTLKVPTQNTDMSFSVSMDQGRMEYAGGSLKGLFGQKRNLTRPRFWGMVSDILRFYREAPALLTAQQSENLRLSLGDYLAQGRYGDAFVHEHLLPMAAAIWSAPSQTMLDFPAVSFVRFCANHGLLQLKDRPQWRTVIGGSREYVKRILAQIPQAEICRSTPIEGIKRVPNGVLVCTENGHARMFDAVVIATHADEALGLLSDPTAQEQSILGSFSYQENLAVLHSDPGLMPKRKSVWAAWNYLGQRQDTGETELCVTYWMNRLQSLPDNLPLFVTLNPVRPLNPYSVHQTFTYSHPVFDGPAVTAQGHLDQIQGQQNTWFCGSYCGYGFHEDAFSSGLRVAAALGHAPPWADQAPAAQMTAVGP